MHDTGVSSITTGGAHQLSQETSRLTCLEGACVERLPGHNGDHGGIAAAALRMPPRSQACSISLPICMLRTDACRPRCSLELPGALQSCRMAVPHHSMYGRCSP